jgi:acetolactate synthase-1/2/3 large subunit
MRVADYIFEQFLKYKIETIFCVTGRGSLYLNDAIEKNKKLKKFFFHHEQSAAYAACTHSQITNKPSICLVSTGVGSTNAISGLLSAWQDGIPCIFISGQNILEETTNFTKKKIRTFGQQEANIIPIIKSITKYSTMLTSIKNLQVTLDNAFKLSMTGFKGPVWIDVPLNLQNAIINRKLNIKFKLNNEKNKFKNFNYIISSLKKAKKPLVLIGRGVKSSAAEKNLKKFLNKNKIPLVYTNSAPDTYGLNNKYCIGSIGSQGCSRAGAYAVRRSDFLLVLGSRINSHTTGLDFKEFAPKANIFVVDIDRTEHSKKGIPVKKFINMDINFFLKKILNFSFKFSWERWLMKNLKNKKKLPFYNPAENEKNRIGLYYLSDKLSKTMPNNSTFICDSGFIDVILPTNISFSNKQICIHPASQGAMGFAIPAIIGAYAQNKNQNIISVIGDGSFAMNLQELITIKYYNINAKIIVINNDLYGIIRRRQQQLFRNRTTGTDETNGLGGYNIKKISSTFGYKYFRLNKKKDLEKDLKNIFELNSPIICEIIGLKNQNYIEMGVDINDNGKLIKLPIDDQFPRIK